MIHTSDPLDRLRAANPVPAGRADQVPPDPVLFRSIVAGDLDRSSLPPAPRRRLRILVPVLAVTGLLGGTVAYALLRDTVPKPQVVGCYERAHLEARTEVVGVGADGPVAACAELWREGTLGQGDQVPPLTECLLDTGVVGVFPAPAGPGVCASLEAPPSAPATPTAPSPPVDVTERFLILRGAVLPQFVDAPCVDPQMATDIVRRELDGAGLGDWRISGAGEFTADRPCATLGFRPESGEVVLVPSQPRR